MKVVNFLFKFFSVVAMLFAASCSDGNNEILSEIDENPTQIGIEPTDSVKVNSTEINNIVSDILSRPKSRQSNYNIETITDENGKELMYVVNYDNNAGFVVISATKKYYPVLAYNYTGNFNIDTDSPIGLNMWYEDIKGSITHVNNLPSDSVVEYRAMWRQYENQAQPSFVSRSTNDITTAQTIMMDSVLRWNSANMTTSDIPQDGLENRNEMSEIEELVMGAIYPEYMDEMYRLSVILHRNITTREEVENFVYTTWGQTGPYSQSFPNGYAGCGPVAAGQIMKYYEHPSTFNWDAMILTYPTKETSDLLYDISVRADAKYLTGATRVDGEDLKNAIKSYGYTADFGNHNPSVAWQNISSRKPVIMKADNMGEDGAPHGWVASGGSCIEGLTQDEVWTFTGRNKFECIHKYNTIYTATYYFYMNWGSGGNGNDYYLDANLKSPETGALATNRAMIYNITPNN